MDFNTTIDDQVLLDGIAFARARDNAARAPEAAIKSDSDWIEIELMHVLRQAARQKCEAQAHAVTAKMLADYDAKMASK